MARKGQLQIQDHIETDEEFEAYLQTHHDTLICMELFSEFCGNCQATAYAVRKGKLEIGGDNIAMAKKGKLTRVMFGANGIELCRLIEEELEATKAESESGIEVPKFDITELLPVEAEKYAEDEKMDKEYMEAAQRLRVLTIAARKQRVNRRLSTLVRRLNFIMFWPQHHQAHYDLYEKWDMLNFQVAAKDTFQLTEETAREALWMSDVDLNEACLHALLQGEVLVVLFKMFDSDDRDFVQVMRHALYEEIPELKEDVPPEKQLPPIPAFERYASISKTAQEVRRDRYNAKMKKLQEEEADRLRLEAEQARLAREAEEERIKAEKQKADEERMARLAAGLPAEPEPVVEPPLEGEAVDGEGVEEEESKEGEKAETEATATDVTESNLPEGEPLTEELGQGEEPKISVFRSDVEIEGEDYIPPGGLFVPGLYSPPNELAKANGLKFFFPKIVSQYSTIESEHLPPHVLVMFPADKRNEVLEVCNQFKDEILNMGFFVGDDPFEAQHVAYTIKQYDKMTRLRKHLDRLALVVSRKRSLPLLQLAGFNPLYISSDSTAGERDCLTLFPVGYGDDHMDEESVVEEEVKVVEEVKEETAWEPPPPEEVEEEEDEEDV